MDPFFNANHPEDFETAARCCGGGWLPVLHIRGGTIVSPDVR
jgi:hypothetical protein